MVVILFWKNKYLKKIKRFFFVLIEREIKILFFLNKQNYLFLFNYSLKNFMYFLVLVAKIKYNDLDIKSQSLIELNLIV